MTTFLQFKELVDLCPTLGIPKGYRFENNEWTMVLDNNLTDSDVRYVSVVDFFNFAKELGRRKNIDYYDWLNQKFGFVFHRTERYYTYSLYLFLNHRQYEVLSGLVRHWGGVNGIDSCC